MKSAQQQLTELQDRHDEFIKLERSIKEVHDMFLEIANLVTQQVIVYPTFDKQVFLYKSVFLSFSIVTCWIWIFWKNNIVTKAARKMLVKLTTGESCTTLNFQQHRV